MKKLAINGGEPIRTSSYYNWPDVNMTKMEEALKRVLYSKKWGSLHGQETSQFEHEFANYQDAKFGIACNSGTTALEIALESVGIGRGDEVIVPAYTFIASASAILAVRAIPVFVDISLESYTIDINDLKNKLTENTKAILPVHIGGRPADMDEILNIATKYNLYVIEDAAQAWGSSYKNRKVGAIGDMGTFSFQSSKNITSAEGGIILTNNEDYAKMAKSLVNCGRKEDGIWYAHYFSAGNYRITEFQTALLREQLKEYEKSLEIRRKNAMVLNKFFMDIEGFTPIPIDDDYRSSVHLYILRYDKTKFENLDKLKFIEALKSEGIPVSPGYSLPLYKQPIFTEGMFYKDGCPFYCVESKIDYKNVYLPNTERACNEEAIWIPQWVMLTDDKGINDIKNAFLKVVENYKELL